MKPGAAPQRQVVGYVVTTLEQGRVDQCVLLHVARARPRAGRRTDAKVAAALGRAEALLLVAGQSARIARVQPELEELRSVGPRCVRLGATDAATSRHPAELTGVEHSRAT